MLCQFKKSTALWVIWTKTRQILTRFLHKHSSCTANILHTSENVNITWPSNFWSISINLELLKSSYMTDLESNSVSDSETALQSCTVTALILHRQFLTALATSHLYIFAKAFPSLPLLDWGNQLKAAISYSLLPLSLFRFFLAVLNRWL